jgi:hypothetical protein
MADQTLTLDETRRESGSALLKLTDEVGFGALGAAWVYNREADRWWFLLVSPMVDTKGPLWIYQRFLQIFQKWQMPDGITPMDIRVASPKEEFFRSFPIKSMPAADQMGITIELANMAINDMTIDRMSIYRMNALAPKAPDNSRLFDLRVRQFLAA